MFLLFFSLGCIVVLNMKNYLLLSRVFSFIKKFFRKIPFVPETFKPPLTIRRKLFVPFRTRFQGFHTLCSTRVYLYMSEV